MALKFNSIDITKAETKCEFAKQQKTTTTVNLLLLIFADFCA